MALTFNGTDHYLSLATPIASGQPFAFSAWFRHPSGASNFILFDLGTAGSNNRFTLTCPNPDEARVFTVRQFANITMTGTTGETGNDTWTHVLCWSNSATDHGTYLNGADLKSSTTSGAPSPTVTSIGAFSDGTSPFNGEIAEVAWWNISIAGNELAMATALAKRYSPLFFKRGLVSYLPMWNDTRDLKGTVWTVNGTGSPAAFPHPPIIYPSSMRARRFTTAAAGGGSIAPHAMYYKRMRAA